jgi:putative DNA primase/helicase
MSKTNPTAETRCLADVHMEPIRWLWQKRMACGKLNILAGQPGLGKSQITARMAAKVSRGGAWPDGARCPIGSVIFICCEDDAADTIVPRLKAANADLAKVHILDWIVERNEQGEVRRRSFDIGKDADRVRELCEAHRDVALIVVDPVSAYLGTADSHKTSDVRAALAPMQAIAADVGACVVLVSHLNKGSGDTSAMSRVAGSGAFVAAARSAWVVGPHPQDESARVFVPLKNNIGDDKNGFVYRIKGATIEAGRIETSCVEFDPTPVQFKAEEVLAASAPAGTPAGGAAEREAVQFLMEELAAGPVPAGDLKARAKDAGVAWRTVERAKRKLEVSAHKDKDAAGAWRWSLPKGAGKGRQDRQDRRPPNDGTGGGVRPEPEDRQGFPSEKVGGVGGLGGAPGHLNGSAGELF